jgi:hypothetical protein
MKQVFLTTNAGTPKVLVWANSREEAVAKTAAFDTDDATPTAWRRAPDFLAGDLGAAVGPAMLSAETRSVTVAGCRFYLDDVGRPHPESARTKRPMEPLAPDPEVTNEEELVAAVEQLRRRQAEDADQALRESRGAPLSDEERAAILGEPFDLFERGSLRRVRVLASRPANARPEDAGLGTRILLRSTAGGVERIKGSGASR